MQPSNAGSQLIRYFHKFPINDNMTNTISDARSAGVMALGRYHTCCTGYNGTKTWPPDPT